eukprot:261753-Pleurochrysis_carterae.AAC.1
MAVVTRREAACRMAPRGHASCQGRRACLEAEKGGACVDARVFGPRASAFRSPGFVFLQPTRGMKSALPG